MESTAAVLAYLQGLGDTPDQVAANLKAQGCKGRIGEPDCCPLANSLKRICDTNVWVDAYEYTLGNIDGKMPDACGQFVARFDRGGYPELIVEDHYEGL